MHSSEADSAKKSHGLELTCNAQFLLAPTAPPVHYRPRFRALALFERRLPERASVSSFPASENLVWAYRCQLKNCHACESFCHVTGLHCATAVPSLGCAERSSPEAVWRAEGAGLDGECAARVTIIIVATNSFLGAFLSSV